VSLEAASARPQQPSEAHIRELPKCELHVHIEGTVRRQTLGELAQRHRIPIRPQERVHEFEGLEEFLQTFEAMCSVLVTAEDFERVMYEYLSDARKAGVLYAEIFFSPAAHTQRGVPIEVVFSGLSAGIKAAERDLGTRAKLVLQVDRRLGRSFAMEMVDYAASKARDILVGVGGGNSERGIDHRQFAGAWAEAGRAGLKRTFHAGEDGPVENVRICVEDLHCERIDHGFYLLDDPALTARVAAERIPVTSCPTSNMRIARLLSDLRKHPLDAQRNRGVLVSVNSDDPGLIHTDVAHEYRVVGNAFSYSLDELESLSLDSIESSWMDEHDKDPLKRHFMEQFDLLRTKYLVSASQQPAPG
jgi:adenosine deaminase